MKRSLKRIALALLAIVTPCFAWAEEVTLPKPVLLVDFGPKLATGEDGWMSVGRTTTDGSSEMTVDNNKNFTTTDSTSNASLHLGITGGNNFNSTTESTFSTAETFANPANTASSGLLAEMKATLGLTSNVPSEVWADGMYNGQQSQTMTITLSGLSKDSSKCYTLYAIYGVTGKNHKTQFNLTGYDNSKTPILHSVEGSANKYTKASGLSVTASAVQTLLLVRVHNLYPNSEGKIIFTTVNNYPGINCLALAETDYIAPPAAIARTLESAAETWGTATEWPNEIVPSTTSNVELKVTSETGSTLTLDTDAVADQLTIGGDYALAFAGAKKLTANTTIINTDTDVSGITASLGAVTLAADKKLTVKTPGVFSSLSATATSVIETTEDYTLASSLSPEDMVIRIKGGKLTLDHQNWTNKFTVANGATLDINGKGNYRNGGAKTAPLITLEDGATLTNSVAIGSDSAVMNELALAENAAAKITGKTFRTIAPGYGKTAIALNGGTLTVEMDDEESCYFNNMYAAKTVDELSAARSDTLPESTEFAGTVKVASGTLAFTGDRALFDRAAIVLASNEGKTASVGLERAVTVGSISSASAADTLKIWNHAFTVGALGTDTEFAGVISGTGAFTKVGAGTLKLSGANTHSGSVTVSAGTLAYASDAAPKSAIAGEGTVCADGAVLDLTRASSVATTLKLVAKNSGTIILNQSQVSSQESKVDASDGGTVKVKVTSYDAIDLSDKVTLAEGANVTFILPSGAEVVGSGATMAAQTTYVYTASAEGENLWSTVANWTLNGNTVASAPAGSVETPVVIKLTAASTLNVDVADVNLTAVSVSGGQLTIKGNPLTTSNLSSTGKVIVANELTLAGGTDEAPTTVANQIEVANDGKLITTGYLECTAVNAIAAGGTLEVASGVTTFGLGDRTLSGTLKVASGATFKTGTADAVNYNQGYTPTLDIAGTLEVTGTARWSLSANTTTTLREGAVLKGVGGAGYDYAYDYFNGGTITVEGNATIEGNIGAHNNGTITFDVAEDKMLTVSGKYDGAGYAESAAKLVVTGAGTVKLTAANTYTGGTTINEGATVEAYTIGNLHTSGAIVVNGRLRLANTASVDHSGSTAYGTADEPRLTGNGVLEINGTGYYALPAGFTTPLALENNQASGIVVPGAPGITVGTLSGNGYFRADWGDNGEGTRVITVKQSKASTFSGYVAAGNNGTRAMTLLVTKAEGVGEDVDTTLTLSGSSTADGTTLSVAEGSVVNLAGSWTQSVVGAGTVKIPTKTVTDLNLSNFADASTTLEIAGTVSGYFNNATWSVAAALKVSGTFELSNGFSSGRYTFTGPLTGDGVIRLARDSAVTDALRFAGDVSGFSGTIEVNDDNSCVVFCAADAAANLREAGKIYVASGSAIVVPEGKTWKANNGVNVYGTIGGTGTIGSALTLNGGATLDATAGKLNVTGDVTLPAEGTVTVTCATTAGTEVLTCANAETLDLTKLSTAPEGLKWVAENGVIKLAAVNTGIANVTINGESTPCETFDDILVAINDDGVTAATVTLSETLSEAIELTSTWVIKNTITLDLNGQTITATGCNAIQVYGGDLTIKDSATGGKVAASGYQAVRVGQNGEDVGGTFTLEAGTLEGEWAITVWENANVTVSGGTVTGVQCGITGNGLRHNTTIAVTGGSVFATANDGCAIYHPQKGTLTIGKDGGLQAPYIQGVTGIEMRAGEVEMLSGTIVATGSYAVAADGSGSTVTGAALAISQHSTDEAAEGIKVNIVAGALSGACSLAVVNTTEASAVPVTGEIVGTALGYGAQIGVPTVALEGNSTDGYILKTVVAAIGENKYATLQEAYDNAAENDTITLLGNTEAPGIKIAKSITLDLNEKTLTLTPPPVGSTGTETLGMQILKTTEAITIKDGTINVCAENLTADKPIKMLIQNYSLKLTLSNVTLDGTNLMKPTNMAIYVLSNNQGTVTIGAGTEIIAPEGGIAFDVCKYASYEAPTVTVQDGATITGIVEVTGGTLDNKGDALDVVVISGTATGAMETFTYVAKIAGVYCTAFSAKTKGGTAELSAEAAAAAADLFTGIATFDGAKATVAYEFGLADIKRNADDNTKLDIIAKVTKGDGTVAGYTSKTKVIVTIGDKDYDATIGTNGIATLTLPITDVANKDVSVKATK